MAITKWAGARWQECDIIIIINITIIIITHRNAPLSNES